MNIQQSFSVFLTEEETYAALEQYIRNRAMMSGVDLSKFIVDDADSSCKNDKGAYFFFTKKESI